MGSETTRTVGGTGAKNKRGTAKNGNGRTASGKRGAAKRVRPNGGSHDAPDAHAMAMAPASRTEAKRGQGIRPPAMASADVASEGVSGERLVPQKARPSRHEREFAEARAEDIDQVCAAWAAIVAERMAADQVFAETFEQYHSRSRDLRGLFLWDALHAAESHVTLVNAVIARHLDGPRADPFAILTDLRAEQRRVAVVYAVNAFLAVLNQMSPAKPKWLPLEDLDPRMAVLALAHQTLEYALEAARIEAPPDLTEHILRAAQDESVWSGARDARDRALAAAAACAAFFRALGSEELSTIDEIVALYERPSARPRRRAKTA